MTNEERIMQGLCSDCDNSIKVWTREEIQAIKQDVGMDEADDFADCCYDCYQKYLPPEMQGRADVFNEAFVRLPAQAATADCPLALNAVQWAYGDERYCGNSAW